MKRMMAAAIVACAVAAMTAQTRPNFSGTWVSIEPKEQAGEEQKVTHSADELILEHGSDGGGHRIVHKLDGKEHDSSLGTVKSTSRGVWQDARLLITENATYPDGRRVKIESTWSLGNDGRLTVDVTRTGPDGKPMKARLVSTKK